MTPPSIPAPEDVDDELDELEERVRSGDVSKEEADERAREIRDAMMRNPVHSQEDATALQRIAAFLERDAREDE